MFVPGDGQCIGWDCRYLRGRREKDLFSNCVAIARSQFLELFYVTGL